MTVKVLYLDDDVILTELFRKKLSKRYEITTVNNFIDFTNAIQDTIPDIVVLDLMMPDVSGLSIVKFLRNTPRFAFIPIMILSGVEKELNLKECLSNGANDFMMKPPNYEELMARLDNLAEHHEVNTDHIRRRKMKSMKLLINGFNHEFNNHLMILQGGLEILNNSINDPKYLTSIQSMQRTVQRATALIRDVSQLYIEGFIVTSSRNLKELLDDFNDQISKEFQMDSIDFHVKSNAELDMFLQISDSNFFMVLKQIVTNSIDSFLNLEDDRNTKIELSIRKQREFVEITVEDNGRGIAPQNLTYVFDPFYTTKGSLGGELISEKRYCAGLGLSLAEAIADCSGGSISLQSKVGKGTKAIWRVPVAKSKELQISEFEPFFRMRRPNAKPFRYLVASTEDTESEELSNYLSLQGCEIKSVQTVKDLGSIIDSETFSLVILDIGFGLDLVKACILKLRANQGKYFPIIVLSCSREHEDFYHYCEKQNVKCFSTPLNLGKLSKCISEIEVQMSHIEKN